MYRSVVICPDVELSGRLVKALESTGHVSVSREIHGYVGPTELIRAVRVYATQIVFLSFEDVQQAHEMVKAIQSETASVQVVAIHRAADPAILRETMRLGLREFLWEPFERNSVLEALSHLKGLIDEGAENALLTDQIFSFLPSKAGVGTSTIALNVSAALARCPDMQVLLSDFDLSSGMIRFMLQLPHDRSVRDAVEHAHEMDDQLWPQLVSRSNGLHVLTAGKISPNYRIEAAPLLQLVSFMRRNYKALCFDLSGNLERYSIELMQESKRVLLVCTPEVASLHLAREKLAFLKELDLRDRTIVILNRVLKRSLLSAKQVEELLEAPVARVFPNDYHGVSRAVTAGAVVAPNSELGKAFSEFALTLIDQKPVASEPKRKFLEFVSMGSRNFV